jgi:hypothetical protein
MPIAFNRPATSAGSRRGQEQRHFLVRSRNRRHDRRFDEFRAGRCNRFRDRTLGHGRNGIEIDVGLAGFQVLRRCLRRVDCRRSGHKRKDQIGIFCRASGFIA